MTARDESAPQVVKPTVFLLLSHFTISVLKPSCIPPPEETQMPFQPYFLGVDSSGNRLLYADIKI